MRNQEKHRRIVTPGGNWEREIKKWASNLENQDAKYQSVVYTGEVDLKSDRAGRCFTVNMFIKQRA